MQPVAMGDKGFFQVIQILRPPISTYIEFVIGWETLSSFFSSSCFVWCSWDQLANLLILLSLTKCSRV